MKLFCGVPGVNVNLPILNERHPLHGMTALHCALLSGFTPELVKVLCGVHGVNVNTPILNERNPWHGHTALHYALLRPNFTPEQSLEFVKVLCGVPGVNVNLPIQNESHQLHSLTALHCAVFRRQKKAVAVLCGLDEAVLAPEGVVACGVLHEHLDIFLNKYDFLLSYSLDNLRAALDWNQERNSEHICFESIKMLLNAVIAYKEKIETANRERLAFLQQRCPELLPQVRVAGGGMVINMPIAFGLTRILGGADDDEEEGEVS